MVPTAVITRRGTDRIRAGHPWIYRSDVVRAEAEPGDLVRVVTERDRPMGWAWFSSESQITLRLMARDHAPIDEDDQDASCEQGQGKPANQNGHYGIPR